jgi:putative ABC transport system permease protein
VAQTSLALVLLVGAGLLLRSFYNVLAVDPGFRVEQLVTMRVLPSSERYSTSEHTVALYDELRQAVSAIPGVRSVALINHLPYAASGVGTELLPDGRARADSSAPNAMFRTVSDEYFSTMDIRIVAGRPLGANDMTPGSDALVVNETLARGLWPNESAVGRRLTVFGQAVGRADYRQPIEGRIVGVVADVRPFGPEQTPVPEVFAPFSTNPWPSAYLAIHTSTDASSVVGAIRRAVLAVESTLPMDELMPMEQRLDGILAQRTMTMLLLGTFAAVALVLAAVGIYGVIAYAVSQRTREIGVRMALGAAPAGVMRLVLREGLVLGVAGIAIGAGGALAATRIISGMLFGVEPTDPAVLGAISVMLLAVTAGATLVPARRAAMVDPVRALRSE